MTTDFGKPGILKLSVNRALLGNVTANLAGVHATFEYNTIVITAYFFVDPSENDREYIEDAASEVIADFPEPYTIETRFGLIADIKLNTIPWNFLRAEAYLPGTP